MRGFFNSKKLAYATILFAVLSFVMFAALRHSSESTDSPARKASVFSAILGSLCLLNFFQFLVRAPIVEQSNPDDDDSYFSAPFFKVTGLTTGFMACVLASVSHAETGYPGNVGDANMLFLFGTFTMLAWAEFVLYKAPAPNDYIALPS